MNSVTGDYSFWANEGEEDLSRFFPASAENSPRSEGGRHHRFVDTRPLGSVICDVGVSRVDEGVDEGLARK